MLGYYAQGIIYCWRGQGQGRAKGQIHLISYNFVSVTETLNLVHVLVYEKPHQIRPWPWPLTLTLTLKSSPKVKIFEIYQWKLAKICLDIMHRASSFVGEIKGQGQGWAKGQIHLISYNFASNCHRDFKLGSCFSLGKTHQLWPWPLTLTLTSDLDLEKFT